MARLERAADPVAEGQRICLELIAEFAGIPGVAGVHIMAPANEAAVPAVIAEARQRLPAQLQPKRALSGVAFTAASERTAPVVPAQAGEPRRRWLMLQARQQALSITALARGRPEEIAQSSAASSFRLGILAGQNLLGDQAGVLADRRLRSCVAMSGLALRKVLAFSRPWPMRWLS